MGVIGGGFESSRFAGSVVGVVLNVMRIARLVARKRKGEMER